MAIYTPKHEDITGADLSGTTGTINRTYTLVNTGAILAQMSILLSESPLQNSVNFTFDTTNGIITFLGYVDDDQPISIDYLVTSTAPELGSYYCNTLQIARASGLALEVFNENLGTGDGSSTSFDTANGNIVDNSYTLKYAASGSNVFNNLIEETHYTIHKDQGAIELTSAGATLLSTNILYIDYNYSPRHSDTLIATYLPQATAEVNKITGNYWGTSKSYTEYFDGYTSGYPQTDEPYGMQIDSYPEFSLRYQSVNSITSIKFIDRQGNTDTTLDTTQYRLITEDDMQESRILINTTIPNGKANVEIIYVHGYDTVPDLVQELTALIGGVMALVNISGGSYKDISTYSFPEGSVSIGQIYVNVRESIIQMKNRIEQIKDILGSNYSCV